MKIKISDHARYDSFPMRFGFVSPEYLELVAEVEDEHATSRQKPREILMGNKHYVGELWTCQGQKLFRARVVLSKHSDAELYPTVITVLEERYIPVDRAVSEIVRAKREAGSLNVEKIIKILHPLYKEGRISSPENLIDIFIEMGVSEKEQKITELESMLANIEAISEVLMKENERTRQENAVLKEKIVQAEKNKLSYMGEAIKVSPISKLIDVRVGKRTNSRGESVNCTYLRFDDSDLPERKMDENFDKSGAITTKARSLIGKNVRTSTWKPEIFKDIDWFRDIYALES